MPSHFLAHGAWAVSRTLSSYCQRILNAKDAAVEPENLMDIRTLLQKCTFGGEGEMRRLLGALETAVGRLQPVSLDSHGLETVAHKANVGFIKPGYIYKLASRGGPFPRRQDASSDGMYVGKLPPGKLWAVSHGWASEMHPSPSGNKLGLLAAKLRELGADPERDGVFLDYISLSQKKHQVPEAYFERTGAANPQLERTREQVQQFGVALWVMSRVYACALAHVIVLPEIEPEEDFPGHSEIQLPWGRVNKVPYHQRGWCCAEYAIANFHGNIVNATDEAVRKVAVSRAWPVSVEAYADMMREDAEVPVHFTAKGDNAVVQYNFFQMYALGTCLIVAAVPLNRNSLGTCLTQVHRAPH